MGKYLRTRSEKGYSLSICSSLNKPENDCPLRKMALVHLIPAEAVASKWMNELEVSDPVAGLYLLGLALIGGRKFVLSNPAMYAKILLTLAFDHHYAPTDKWVFNQRDLQSFPNEDGWQPTWIRNLTRQNLMHILRADRGAFEAARAISNDALSSQVLSFNTFSFESSEFRSTFDGISTQTSEISTHAGESIGVFVGLSGQYKENNERVELSAGRIFRDAIVGSTIVQNAEITPHFPPPGDIRIEGLIHLVEHTKADSRPWKELGRKGKGRRPYSKTEELGELFKELDRAIRRKLKYTIEVRRGLILLLDSGVLRFPTSAIERYMNSRKAYFEESGFVSIWFVCRHSETATCLFRREV